MERTLSAPGKLFLSGEYAVLWGGTARLVATGPRAQAMFRPREDRLVEIALADGKLVGEATPAGVRWRSEVTEAYRFVATTFDLALRITGTEGPGFSAAFEPSPLVNGQKLGLGSSARATVLAAEIARLALGASFDALKLALIAHADAQGGKGSGADVSTSFAGGLIRYRAFGTKELIDASKRGGLSTALDRSQPVDVQRMSAPLLPLAWAFTGQSASTTGLVKSVESRLAKEARASFVERSDALGDELEKCLLRGDFPGVEAACDSLHSLLSELAETQTEALGRIRGLASTFGCVAKQSGAGGGDGAIVFCRDVDARRDFLSACKARGLTGFEVTPAAGLQGEVTRHPELSKWL